MTIRKLHGGMACPFCGSTDLTVPIDRVRQWVQCENTACQMEGPLGNSVEEAVDKWNTRVKVDTPLKQK